MTFVSVDQSGAFTPLAAPLASDDVVDVADIDSFAALDPLVARDRIVLRAESCSDGRVFGLARQLRRRGFDGALVVEANLLPDQLPMATSSGIDAIVISENHALRCAEPQWRLKAQGERFGYQRATGRSLLPRYL